MSSSLLNRREASYLYNRLDGMNPSEAYRAAGYDMESVTNISTAIAAKERKVMQSQFVKDVASKHGLNIDVFMLKLTEILDAQTQKEYCFKGDVIEGEARPDYRTRMRALEIMGKMLNITRSEEENDSDRITNTINILQIGDKYQGVSEEDLRYRMQCLKMGRAVEVIEPMETLPSGDEWTIDA